ncbi:MAG: hypothetical protein B0D85_00725 [Candidatus Sedimenticola endophacoides]|nr:MAG: hypothetical protein B0D85_00725 [Candidatus Sedimenticola endophacoides]
MAALRRGGLRKLVLARRIRVTAQRTLSERHLVQTLACRHPGCTIFAADLDDGTWVGASPEVLLDQRAGRLLSEAVAGTEAKIRVPTMVKCNVCSGSGAKKGSQPKTCGTCAGHGQVRMQQGFFSVQQTCPNCRGKGTVIDDPCGACHGVGRVEQHKTLSVKVPAGVDTGDRIRLAGEGEAGENGGPPGDLYVQVGVKQHEIFTREENHLFCEVPISFVAAALGGELEVPTLDGKVVLKIPAGTQSGKLFRMRGKGVRPVRGGAVGDLLCRVMVETPVNLTERQKDLLRQLDETMRGSADRHSPQSSSWLDGVKRFIDGFKA